MTPGSQHLATLHELNLLLRSDEVSELISVSTRTLWRMVAKKQFPQPVRYNRKLVRWPLRAVKEWLELQKQG